MDNIELSTSRYPLMKDSGIEWFGEIPATWKIKVPGLPAQEASA